MSRHLHTRTCSGESDVRGQAEKQRDTNGNSTFDRARCEENKIHSAVLAGFAYENLTKRHAEEKPGRIVPAGLQWQCRPISRRWG